MSEQFNEGLLKHASKTGDLSISMEEKETDDSKLAFWMCLYKC